MNKVCTLSILLLLSIISHGQTRTINSGGIEIQVTAADSSVEADFLYCGQMPKFPGGTAKLVAFAKRKIRYPNTAIDDNIEGSVILQFTINKRGRVINKKIVQNIRYDLDSVCLKMLDKMPIWKPGLLNNKPNNTNERWKITFILNN
ncbi:MAG: energy transducer TonB, partial [Chitinophagaceae bacterium]|nr:energy transducer TonB [Chitinophagaceae bacterium]